MAALGEEVRERIGELLDEGLSYERIAAQLGVSKSAANRWGRRIRPNRGLSTDKQRKLEAHELERIRILAEDGVPAAWIAEEMPVQYDTVRKAMLRMGLKSDPEYHSIQVSIRRNPKLAPLHEEFCPKFSHNRRSDW